MIDGNLPRKGVIMLLDILISIIAQIISGIVVLLFDYWLSNRR